MATILVDVGTILVAMDSVGQLVYLPMLFAVSLLRMISPIYRNPTVLTGRIPTKFERRAVGVLISSPAYAVFALLYAVFLVTSVVGALWFVNDRLNRYYLKNLEDSQQGEIRIVDGTIRLLRGKTRQDEATATAYRPLPFLALAGLALLIAGLIMQVS